MTLNGTPQFRVHCRADMSHGCFFQSLSRLRSKKFRAPANQPPPMAWQSIQRYYVRCSYRSRSSLACPDSSNSRNSTTTGNCAGMELDKAKKASTAKLIEQRSSCISRSLTVQYLPSFSVKEDSFKRNDFQGGSVRHPVDSSHTWQVFSS